MRPACPPQIFLSKTLKLHKSYWLISNIIIYYRHKEGEKTLDGKPSFFAGERYRKVKYEAHHLWDRVRHEFCTHGASWIGRQCFSSQRQIDGSRGNRIERNSAEVAPVCRWNKRGLMLFIGAYWGRSENCFALIFVGTDGDFSRRPPFIGNFIKFQGGGWHSELPRL